MKIVIVSHSAVVQWYREKYHALAGLGCEIHLILPRGWPEGGRWLAAPPPGEENGVRIHVLPVRLAGRLGWFSLAGLGRLIRSLDPDLVHVEEEPYSLTCWQSVGQARRLRKPAVFFTWENILRGYKPPLPWFDAANLKRAGWAIAGNREGVEVLRRRGFGGKAEVIPQYGVNLDHFHPMPEIKEAREEPFTLGYVGRLLPEKGIAFLLKTCAKLNFPFKLWIVGSGPAEMDLRRLAESLNLQRVVFFESAVAHEQVPALLNRLHALVLPSETWPVWKEQFGRILIEAMACEVPVIGSDSGEIPQVVGTAGLIFTEGREDQLLRFCNRLQDDKLFAADLGRRGRERVQALFTQERIAERTYAFYQDILSGKP